MNPAALPGRAAGSPVHALPTPLSAWLTDVFLPLWARRALADGQPGYVETMRRDGAALPLQPRSTLVTARLVYTFSFGHALAGGEECRRAAAHGLAFLRDACRLGDGRFAHLPARAGEPATVEAELYDLAFVLLALAGYGGAFGDDSVLALVETVAGDLDGRLAHPCGGYRDPGVDGARRRQFSHMHLFEPLQILSRLRPGTGWEGRCEVILDIVEHHLIAANGSIAEWYRPDWSALGETEAAGCEIGHQFEWSWLLLRHGRTAGSARATALGARLYRFAVAAAGLGAEWPAEPLPNVLDRAYRPAGGARPLWPLAELLRASLAMEITGGTGAGEAARLADAAARRLFERYLHPRTGLWINETDDAGQPLGEEIPLRVLYHLVPALAAYSEAREGAFATPSLLFDGGLGRAVG